MRIPLAEAVAAMRARVIGAPPQALDCTIDTRSLRAGQTYVVVRGARFDGHDFLAAARDAGAAAAIVERADAVPEGLPALVVPDAAAALLQAASLAREHFCGAVVGVTGSAGKTTTKEFLRQILQGVAGQRVCASPANENNEIGVAKVLLRLESESAAIVEMGARHYGDIGVLAALARPHIGVLTNIGEAHREIFGSLERLAETKWQLLGLGARAALCAHDATSRARARTLGAPPVYFGVEEPGLDAPEPYEFLLTLDGERMHLRRPDGSRAAYALAPEVPGRHNLLNAAAACAAALMLGHAPEAVARAARALRQPAGRYERRAGRGGVALVHDAYNASPDGVRASLEAFAREPATRRIVVFGSMAELGDRAPSAHAEVGAAIARANVDLLFTGGRFAADVECGATDAGFDAARIHRYATNPELLAMLQGVAAPGDAILIKGSRMYRLEEIVDALSESRAT